VHWPRAAAAPPARGTPIRPSSIPPPLPLHLPTARALALTRPPPHPAPPPRRSFNADSNIGNSQDLLEQNQNVQTGIFAVLHVLTRERLDVRYRYAVAKVVVDWLQLFLLLVRGCARPRRA